MQFLVSGTGFHFYWILFPWHQSHFHWNSFSRCILFTFFLYALFLFLFLICLIRFNRKVFLLQYSFFNSTFLWLLSYCEHILRLLTEFCLQTFGSSLATHQTQDLHNHLNCTVFFVQVDYYKQHSFFNDTIWSFYRKQNCSLRPHVNY